MTDSTTLKKRDDDINAFRKVIEALERFSREQQGQILRWVVDKLNLSVLRESTLAEDVSPRKPLIQPNIRQAETYPTTDVRSFVQSKNPTTDVHFAATVSYYYRFVASRELRKDAITADDFVEACRQVNRKLPNVPQQTLRNAFHAGFFDRDKAGEFRLNNVGENLVAMALPADAEHAATVATPSKENHRQARANKKKTLEQKNVKRKGHKK